MVPGYNECRKRKPCLGELTDEIIVLARIGIGCTVAEQNEEIDGLLLTETGNDRLKCFRTTIDIPDNGELQQV